MTAAQAREAARRWIGEEGAGIPGFRGAYTAGSTNWLAADAALPAGSDVDVMVVMAGTHPANRRRKFVYRGALLETSLLGREQLGSADRVLSDYHLAPGLAMAKVVFDPTGELTPLRESVARRYGERQWVLRRCRHAWEKVRATLQSAGDSEARVDQAMSCLFAAGITTHVLLAAGMRNPTVRMRYTAVRDLLAECAQERFHETLLELLGSAGVSRVRADGHLSALAEVFDAAKAVGDRTSFPFAADISACGRPAAIDSCAEMIAGGSHREAMFWMGVTHGRCLKVLGRDGSQGFEELIAGLGMESAEAVRRRCSEIEAALPAVWDMAVTIAGRYS